MQMQPDTEAIRQKEIGEGCVCFIGLGIWPLQVVWCKYGNFPSSAARYSFVADYESLPPQRGRQRKLEVRKLVFQYWQGFFYCLFKTMMMHCQTSLQGKRRFSLVRKVKKMLSQVTAWNTSLPQKTSFLIWRSASMLPTCGPKLWVNWRNIISWKAGNSLGCVETVSC